MSETTARERSPSPAGRPQASLDDKFQFEGRPYFLNGTQSLVRLMQLEKRRRASQGRKTAVYVAGYRGSPLGSLDQTLARAAKFLGPDIKLWPAVNEDLAATAIWGTQQVGTFGDSPFDGVSAAWYGKGPGVDRSGDAFKHGNLAGSAREGGVLVIAGDDHTCKSSTTAHQSEFALIDAMIPVLAPASIFEQMAFGLIGWELSRYSGLWAALKVVTEIMDSSESLSADPNPTIRLPADQQMPDGGLSLRWPDTPLAQEERLHQFKLPAALAFARANRLDHEVFGDERARIGVITVGKAYADTRRALADLGLAEDRACALGIRLFKVAMPWPLEPHGVRHFARGLEQIVVVEEKRGLVEDQLRAHLYGLSGAPVIVGKRDELGAQLFPSNGELGSDMIAVGIGRRVSAATGDEAIGRRLEEVEARLARKARAETLASRPPHFCPGCPHNTSTKVPEGSKAFAGIGCHYLVLPMERETGGFTQMGGEGANWIGLSPFSTTSHMFQNIGDGTYFHSGSLAIRAAIAAKVNITYKILFNSAVAMTGGQAMDGDLSLRRLTDQVLAEGAREVVVVSDDPSRYTAGFFQAGVGLRPREDLEKVQRTLRQLEGVSVLVFDQTCATELRRLRKRGEADDPKLSIVINDLVCEGCGDCSRVSNCLAVAPLDTEFGRKRRVDPSSCNKDQSCLGGFCPSFVTVLGGVRRKPTVTAADPAALPDPVANAVDRLFSMVVTGVGGTGVVTIGSIIGMAAHLDGKAIKVMDMTGLAQKGGAVVSHVQIGSGPEAIDAAKVGAGAADLVLVCDLVVGASPDNLGRVSSSVGHVIANDHETATGLFTRDAEAMLPIGALRRALTAAVPNGQSDFLDATELATSLVGDAVGANLFLVGFAWQRGLIPVSRGALERAIELNGVSVSMNRNAFTWGRRAAIDIEAVRSAAAGERPAHHIPSTSLAEKIARRVSFLTEYQDAAYAGRYAAVVQSTQRAEVALGPRQALTEAVSDSLFRLMAYKDEYEVARLYTDTGFMESLATQFEGSLKIQFHLAPPLLARKDPTTGHPRKMRFGPWMKPLFTILARARRIRGTRFDVFGYTAERRMERRLVAEFVTTLIDDVLPALCERNYDAAVEVARSAQAIKGFGHVKLQAVDVAASRRSAALERFRRDAVEPLFEVPSARRRAMTPPTLVS